METLLTVAVILTTLAIIVQAGVLVGMYLISRRVTNNVDSLISESKRVTEPLESVSRNLKSVSEDLTDLGKTARSQVLKIQELLNEARETVFVQATDVKDQVLCSFEEARETVMRPVRQWSRIAEAIAAGFRTFFARRSETEPTEEIAFKSLEPIESEERRDYPAA